MNEDCPIVGMVSVNDMKIVMMEIVIELLEILVLSDVISNDQLWCDVLISEIRAFP